MDFYDKVDNVFNTNVIDKKVDEIQSYPSTQRNIVNKASIDSILNEYMKNTLAVFDMFGGSGPSPVANTRPPFNLGVFGPPVAPEPPVYGGNP